MAPLGCQCGSVAACRSMVDASNKWRGIGARRSLVARAQAQSKPAAHVRLKSDFSAMRKRSSIFQGAIMHLLSRVTVLFALTGAPLSAMAEPASAPPPVAGAGVAESVHVQPRGETFAPNSAEVDAVQKSITIFNATQGVLDVWFDRKKLTICRGC